MFSRILCIIFSTFAIHYMHICYQFVLLLAFSVVKKLLLLLAVCYALYHCFLECCG